jgi:hypothetical protein
VSDLTDAEMTWMLNRIEPSLTADIRAGLWRKP